MTRITDVRRLVWQTRAYEYADGLREITLGLLLMLTGLAVTFLPAGTGVIGAVILAALIYASNWGVSQIRLRFIWPRTGYAKPNWADYRRFRFVRIAFILAVELVLMAVMFFTLGYSGRIVILAVASALFYISEWVYCRQLRWLVIGLGVPLVALVTSGLAITPAAGVFVMMLYLGLSTFVNGIYALSRNLWAGPAERTA